jgi:Mn-dependent DtxR family transcriptional regulator
MSKYKKVYEVYDIRTGEKVDYKYILTQKQMEKLEEKNKMEKALKYGKSRKFAQIKRKPIRWMMSKLTFTEAGAFIKLLPYIHYNQNTLSYSKDGEFLKRKDIAKILGKSEERTKKILKKLCEVGAINKQKIGRENIYIVNERFAYIGKMKNKKSIFTRLYLMPIKDKSKEMTLEELGFLYSIIPFFHYQTYALCHNPDCVFRDQIQFIRRTELAELLKVSPNTVTNLFNKLNKRGVIMYVKAYGVNAYILNPRILSRVHPLVEISSPEYRYVTDLFDAMLSEALREQKSEA